MNTYHAFMITKITQNGLSLNFYIDKMDKSEFNNLVEYKPPKTRFYIRPCEDDEIYSVVEDGKVAYNLILEKKGSFCLEKYRESGLYETYVKERDNDVLLNFNYPLKVIKCENTHRGIYHLSDGSVLSYICKDDVYEFKHDDKIIFSKYEPSPFTLFKKKYDFEKLCVSLCSMNSKYPKLEMFDDKVFADNLVIQTLPAQRHYFVAKECIDDVITELKKQEFKPGNCRTNIVW